jgi:pimeloyl-ACP methyl ester carboxylesterase
MKNFLRNSLLLTGTALALSSVAPSTSGFAGLQGIAHAGAAPDTRGKVVSVTSLGGLSKEATGAYLTREHFGSPVPRNGVTILRVIYRTVTPKGAPTTASGLVVLPRTAQRRLRVVDYEHGTNPTKSAAATVDPASEDRAAGLLFAAAGYAAVAPDYLGLGYGPGRHPYMDAASETTASVDMLRAARIVAQREGRRLDGRILVTGFSQGGQAAMALGRALQGGVDHHLRLAALAPVSGPYDVQHAELPVGLAAHSPLDPKEVTFYFSYWLSSMNRLHGIYKTPFQVFKSPYDKTVDGLFDGFHSGEQTYRAIPATPQQIFTAKFMQQLKHPTGALLKAFQVNDTTCTNWVPQVPTRLWAARGDRDVTIVNAQHCEAALRAHGVKASITDVGDTDHTGSALRSIPQIVRWFETLAKP